MTGRRVLVVDGNVDAAESLALLLRLCGHDCATAHTGPDALAAATAHAPDAVFLAIDLPGLDGYEVCRRLCGGVAGPRPRLLVALTGHGQDGARRATAAAGFDHHLLKPADPDHLLRLLTQPSE
ncbi:MAG: response regulator [Gemmataceae bacterium]|nr:response regulator [Gemmataceae bacterium]